VGIAARIMVLLALPSLQRPIFFSASTSDGKKIK